MNKLAEAVLLISFVVGSTGCQTKSAENQVGNTSGTKKESTIYLCVNTTPPDAYTDMIDFKKAERIEDFTVFSSELLFRTQFFPEGIYRSGDSGKTWEKVKIPNIKGVSALNFIDSQNGVLTDDNFNLWKTADSGKSWAKTSELKSVLGDIGFAKEVEFSTIDQGIVYSGDKDIFETSDGGKNWKAIKIPDYADRIIYNSLDDKNARIAFGENANVMHVSRKDNGNWKNYEIKNAANYSDPEAISFLDRDTGWISSDMGELFFTKDGGKTWEKVKIPSTDLFIKSIFWNDSQKRLVSRKQ